MSSIADRLDGRSSLALLAQAGAVLATSLDFQTTLRQVAELTVPELADLCVIDLAADDGSIRGTAVAAADARVASDLERLRSAHPLDPGGNHPVARVLRTGLPEWLAELTPEMLSAFAQARDHARFMLDRGYRSAIVVPLAGRERILGVISMLRFVESPPFGEDAFELICELARRASLALDNARLFSELRGTEARLQAMLSGLAEAVTVHDSNGKIVFANDAAARLLYADSVQELTDAAPGAVAERFTILDERGRSLVKRDLAGHRLFAGEQISPTLTRNIVRSTGEERWLLTKATLLKDPSTVEPLAINVIENVTEVKRAQLREQFLSDVGAVLASSMDHAETLRRVARLAVPTIADWCSVSLISPRGEIESVAVHHSDPSKVALAERLHRDYPVRPDDPGGVAQVIRDGVPVLFTEIDRKLLERHARDPEHLRLLRRINTRSALIVPMLAGERVSGAITLATAESYRRLTVEHMPLAQELGRRAGTAVENARLYTEHTAIAHTLQTALLPEHLPKVRGARVAVRYQAAGELNEVGGDFYDLFDRGDGTWVVSIGDVCGKGAPAAAVTASARYTIRAVALGGLGAAPVLERLNRVLAHEDDLQLCTAGVAIVQPQPDGSLRVELAIGGHPRPLLVSATGTARAVGEPGRMLGVMDPIDMPVTNLSLAPGEMLLWFTDGVTDAGAPADAFGEEGLLALVASEYGDLDRLLEAIVAAANARSRGRPRDDVALLALRAGGSP